MTTEKKQWKLILALLISAAISVALVTYKANIFEWLMAQPLLYVSSDTALKRSFEAQEPISLQWSQLLPNDEKSVLQKYQQQQASTATQFADNILLSLEASVDEAYNAAMISTNTIDTFDDRSVSIAGFIVPIDFSDEQSVKNIFIVPYFGACLHFPPPPPNQIIFAQLDGTFTGFKLDQAYRLHGVLRRGLFEDPLGTSAYILDVVSIEAFFEDPDDFRQH